MCIRDRLDAPALATSVRRVSLLATWCIALAAYSGALNASVRLGNISAIGSTYGLVVVAKVAALGALGFAGWWMRSAILPVSYTHLRAHEAVLDLVCRLPLEKKNT